jgi:hypothetical protein
VQVVLINTDELRADTDYQEEARGQYCLEDLREEINPVDLKEKCSLQPH